MVSRYCRCLPPLLETSGWKDMAVPSYLTLPKVIHVMHVGVPNHAFAQWRMDLVGPLSGANECFLMVLTEYLTKWAEVYPLPNKQATTVFKCLKK